MFNFNQSDAVAFILPKLSDANYFFKVKSFFKKKSTPYKVDMGVKNYSVFYAL